MEDYLLRRIAFCGECGQPLHTRRYASGRHYICAAVRQARGTCTAAPIPADVAEAQVLARLETFVGDVEQWVASRADDAHSERELFERGVREQRAELARLTRRAERARDQHDRLLDEGDEQLAATALREVARIERERDQLGQALADAERHLAEWQAPDLDYYKELRDAIAGRVANAKSVRDLNAALKACSRASGCTRSTTPRSAACCSRSSS
jgi:inorganic triphosphatase YgiF